jgi:hypothetical protein
VFMGGTLRKDWWTSLQSPELDRSSSRRSPTTGPLRSPERISPKRKTVAVARGGLFPTIDAVAGPAAKIVVFVHQMPVLPQLLYPLNFAFADTVTAYCARNAVGEAPICPARDALPDPLNR